VLILSEVEGCVAGKDQSFDFAQDERMGDGFVFISGRMNGPAFA
jgi:hypothetical protein